MTISPLPDPISDAVDLSAIDPERWRDDLAGLIGDDTCWFPVRHHSPACARHVRALIDDVRPYAVLVEGPRDFTDLIPLLLHPEAVYPLAVFAHSTATQVDQPEPVRHGSYFPLCDYSPELVALRAGKAGGAELQFIDADHQVLSRLDGAIETGALNHESHLGFSEALAAAARLAGCRDHNDLWDHLFETSERTTADFVDSVAAYGLLARSTVSESQLEVDGTLAREAVMASEIAQVAAERQAAGSTAPIVVVTGAFHTSALRALLSSDSIDAGHPGTEQQVHSVTESGRHLVRYGFAQLEALNGYASGMPSPAWYQRLFEAADHEGVDGRHEMLLDVLSDIAAQLRERGPAGVTSTPSMIAAMQQAIDLGTLRGRAMPGRTDLLDAVTSCFIQGDIDTEGLPVLAAARSVLTGDRIGSVPPGTDRPPIADDFDRRARALRLPIETSAPRRVDLDIHRNLDHREKSRFLHGLEYLGVLYGQWLSGPRHGSKIGTRLIRETWMCQLTPATDVGLVEASMFGPTVAEAVEEKFVAAIAQLESGAASASEVARHLAKAAELGVHQAIPRVITHLRRQAMHDPKFDSLVDSLIEVQLLWTSRAALDGRLGAETPALVEMLYDRSCFLLDAVQGLPETEVNAALRALLRLRDGLSGGDWSELDPELFWNAVARLDQAKVAASLAGAVVGLQWSSGSASDDAVVAIVRGRLIGRSDNNDNADFLRGLLLAAREIVWQVPALTRVIAELMGEWDDLEFLRRLPGLRSAFSALTPRETDRVADLVGSVTGATVVTDLDENALLDNLALDATVADLLRGDGVSWIESS